MRIPLVATCLFGLEHLLGEEIDALGYERIATMDGRVTFLGDEEAIALSNVFLRYAERVYIKVGSFVAETFDALFEGVRALPWEQFIGKRDAFPVKGGSLDSVKTVIYEAVLNEEGAVVTIEKIEGVKLICKKI